jgi:hypothetical protein
MSKAREIQKEFLNRVKVSLPANAALVEEVAEVLNASIDSAYRRIRGETLLSIDEISLICAHFRVPFDTTTQPDANSVSFDYIKLDGKQENFSKWLYGLGENVRRIGEVKGSNILYAADDVPIWHHFYHDDLTAFKLFYWLKSILNIPAFAEAKFDPDLVNQDLIKAGRELLKNYNRIPSTEVWSEDTLNSTLKQVEYFWESGFFQSKQEALHICELIWDELNLIQLNATRETKTGMELSGEPEFRLYSSEVMIGNNSILVNLGTTKTGMNKVAYVSNNTFNMMSTTNPDFVNENENWLKNLIRKSVLISGVSEKQRNQFFLKLRNKIEALKESIQ